MWCIQEISAEYRTKMYRLLELYQQGYDPEQPVICMDEKSKQLLEDTAFQLKQSGANLKSMITNTGAREHAIYL